MLDAAAATEHALKLIRSAGALRSPGLAEKLGMSQAELEQMLDLPEVRSHFVTCGVTLGDGSQAVEYRCSASGGKYNVLAAMAARGAATAPRNQSTAGQAGDSTRVDTGAHHEAERDSSNESPATAPARPADPQKENGKMKAHEQIAAAFAKHGAMGAAELSKHVKVNSLGYHLAAGASATPPRFARLSGRTSGTIWGLPGQEVPPSPHAGVEKGDQPNRTQRGRRLKKTSRIPSRTVEAKKPRSAFRPALASDGAILFMGAKGGDFEIARKEVRAVLDLVRRLTPAELGATATFLERLDKAEVGA